MAVVDHITTLTPHHWPHGGLATTQVADETGRWFGLPLVLGRMVCPPPTIILAWHTDLPWLSVGVLWLAAAGFVGVGGALLAMFVDTPTEG